MNFKRFRFNLGPAEVASLILIVLLLATASHLIVNYRQANQRDTQREENIEILSQSLNRYYIDHGTYPKRDSGARLEEDRGLQTDLYTYLEGKTLQDPLYPKTYKMGQIRETYCYFYRTKDGGAEYHLFAKKETKNNFLEAYSSNGHDIAWTGSQPLATVINNADIPFVSSDPSHLRVTASQKVKASGLISNLASNQIEVGSAGVNDSANGPLKGLDLSAANQISFDLQQNQTGEKVLAFLEKSQFLSSGENNARDMIEDDQYL